MCACMQKQSTPEQTTAMKYLSSFLSIEDARRCGGTLNALLFDETYVNDYYVKLVAANNSANQTFFGHFLFFVVNTLYGSNINFE